MFGAQLKIDDNELDIAVDLSLVDYLEELFFGLVEKVREEVTAECDCILVSNLVVPAETDQHVDDGCDFAH